MSDSVLVPPVLYLPVRDLPDGGQLAEVKLLADGRSALLAYTALDRLATHCGEKQPWVLFPTDRIGEIRQEQPFDLVVFDIAVPAALREDGRIA